MADVKKVALHEVEYRDGKKKALAAPGSVFEIDSETAKKLEKVGAVRDPNEAELALFEKQAKAAASRKPAAKPAEDEDGDKGGDKGDAKGAKGGGKPRQEAPV